MINIIVIIIIVIINIIIPAALQGSAGG